MNDLKEEDFIIKDRSLVLIVTITLLIIVLVISLSVTKNFYVSLLIVFIYLSVSIPLVIILRKTYIFSKEGISIRNKFGETKVKWNDVLSMSFTDVDEGSFYFQIKTKSKTINISDFLKFEKIKDHIIDWANLELEAESSLGGIYKIPLQRWKKKDVDYVYTSLADRFSSWLYFYPERHFKRVTLGLLLFIFILGLLLFRLFQYYWNFF